jgi:probable phosphoglycerate mutase
MNGRVRETTPTVTTGFFPRDGETHEVFASRLSLALSRVAECPIQTRIVVPHGVAGRVIRGAYEGLDKRQALRLETPQDAIFRLDNRRVERISTEIA